MSDESSPQGFRARLEWLGKEVETLADIAPREGMVVLVGINPAPVSVAAGHYFQGTMGNRLWGRLRRIGLLEQSDGWEDELFARAGNGLTDIVKRPTASANEVNAEELDAGARILLDKIKAWKPGLVLFAFKPPADALLGGSIAPGPGPPLADIPTFRLTGPYAASEKALANEEELRQLLGVAPKSTPGSPGPQGHLPSGRTARTARGAATADYSQRVTAADKERGQIRFPRPAKRFFPSSKKHIVVLLRGVRTEGFYDPRTGPDRERSAVLRVGKDALASVVVDDRLRVSALPDGLVVLE